MTASNEPKAKIKLPLCDKCKQEAANELDPRQWLLYVDTKTGERFCAKCYYDDEFKKVRTLQSSQPLS